jgi:2-keto-4-pentenoate hydratase/2-oxohepta-3-ene-1,7-dioic acid hydratase in catechol pathway
MRRFLRGGLAVLSALCWSAGGLVAAVSNAPDTPFKLATFEANGNVALGMVLDDRVVLELTGANAHVAKHAKLPSVRIPAEMRELIEQYSSVNKRLYEIANYFKANPPDKLPFAHAANQVTYKAPIKYPWNLLAIAANYPSHAAGAAQSGRGGPAGFDASVLSKIDPDRDAPIFFAKSPRSCIIDPGATYYIPPGRERIDWEGELAIIIGKQARLVQKDRTHDYVFGYSIMYDLSDRGGGSPRRTVSMFPGVNWFEGKSIDRGAPFGPVIVPKEFIPNAEDLHLVTKINGQVMQDDYPRSMIWKERHMLAYLSEILTLYPGDVISSGTPAGTGMERQKFLKPDDVVSIEIEKIGTLTTHIQAWPDKSNP